MSLRGVVYVTGGVVFGWWVASCVGGEDPRVERVAEAEHIQWMAWSKNVAPEVSPERRARWKQFWVPYAELPEDIKELDREWARKALKAADGK